MGRKQQEGKSKEGSERTSGGEQAKPSKRRRANELAERATDDKRARTSALKGARRVPKPARAKREQKEHKKTTKNKKKCP